MNEAVGCRSHWNWDFATLHIYIGIKMCLILSYNSAFVSAAAATDSGAHVAVQAEVCNSKLLESCGIYMTDFNDTKYSAWGHEERRQERPRETGVLLTAGPGDLLHKTRKTSVSCFYVCIHL